MFSILLKKNNIQSWAWYGLNTEKQCDFELYYSDWEVQNMNYDSEVSISRPVNCNDLKVIIGSYFAQALPGPYFKVSL